MEINREVCLFLTLRCNQKCRYCHRVLGIEELDVEHNKKIINILKKEGIKNLTFTGGEPLLYSNIIGLLKFAKEKGIKSKIITNGEILAQNPESREIYDYLDSITLSIDSVDKGINEKLGRGTNHFEHIKTVLDTLKDINIKVNINTVVSKINKDYIEDLGSFLSNYNLNAWRIFKFAPLRETAKKNRKEFEISSVDFKMNKSIFTSFPKIKKVEFREDDDMQNKYVLIMPNGNVMITEKDGDVTIGNLLENNLSELLKNRVEEQSKNVLNKIRTLISYNDNNVRDFIVEKVKKLNYVEIIGVSDNGNDTFSKILDLKPEMVFSNYNLDNMTGLELMRKSKETLNEKMPIFNFITDYIPENDLKQMIDIADNKVNAVIKEEYKANKIVSILEDYKEFKDRG